MKYEEVMPKKLRHDEFKLESIGTVLVSTIALPPWMVDTRTRFETAVIWDAQHALDDGYRIMHVGYNQWAAEDVHQYWCDTERLAALICIAVTASSN